MRNLAKSIHVALICVILLTGYLHSSSIVSIEDTEEIQLRIYDSYESHEDDSLLGLDEDVLLIGAVMLVVAFSITGIGVLYVWANSLASNQPESGTRNSYAASDASASTSSGTDDVLMRLYWDYAEDDLNWAFVTFRLGVGDMTYDCHWDGTEECSIGQDGSDAGTWETSEFLSISESGYDICSSYCDIDIYVTYRGIAVSGTSTVSVA
ncbi:MAG: hypothetical protein QGF94_02425 [Candidatus Thalassarchaeaceae archaeon]|jgi:hypothetical protein|nr:hypothetical protein [Candidatus Thalassarchaeaceae archaeon]